MRFSDVSSGGNLAGGLGRKKKGFLLSTEKLLTLPYCAQRRALRDVIMDGVAFKSYS
jgi:hypothetical protein